MPAPIISDCVPAVAPQGLCLDKGYDYDEVRQLAREFGYIAHIRKRDASRKARQWVVERAHSWLNRFQRILIRWEEKAGNYLGRLHLACAIITYRGAEVLG